MKNYEYIANLAKEFEDALAQESKDREHKKKMRKHADDCYKKFYESERELKDLIIASGKIGFSYNGSTYIVPSHWDVLSLSSNYIIVVHPNTKESKIIDNFITEKESYKIASFNAAFSGDDSCASSRKRSDTEKVFSETIKQQGYKAVKVGSRVYYTTDFDRVYTLDLPGEESVTE